MNVNRIRHELEQYIGIETVIKYNLGRNKYEKYRVKIKALYQNVFIVEEIKDGAPEYKCFSYSDIVMKNIRFYFEKEN